MILYKNNKKSVKKERDIKTLPLEIEELPERHIYVFKNNKDRNKFIGTVEALVRRSEEYKSLIRFLKTNMDMSRCSILKNLQSSHGKKYSIEVHHEPFTLREIVDTVINKFEANNEEINPFKIADEVMLLHYEEKVGLIPLSKTMHELAHSDKIFIPLQMIYQGYGQFYEEYEPYISDVIKEKIELKVNLSLKCNGDVLSDAIDVEFVYMDVDGFEFPQIPEDWNSGRERVPMD